MSQFAAASPVRPRLDVCPRMHVSDGARNLCRNVHFIKEDGGEWTVGSIISDSSVQIIAFAETNEVRGQVFGFYAAPPRRCFTYAEGRHHSCTGHGRIRSTDNRSPAASVLKNNYTGTHIAERSACTCCQRFLSFNNIVLAECLR